MLFNFNDFFYFISLLIKFIGFVLVYKILKMMYQSYKSSRQENYINEKNEERLSSTKEDYILLAEQMKRADYCDDEDIDELKKSIESLQNSFAVKNAYEFWCKTMQRKYHYK